MRDYLDIIIFALIAVGLLWRLRSVLGERSDADAMPPANRRAQTIEGKAVRQGDTPVGAATDNQGAQDRWAQNPPDFTTVETATAHSRLSQFHAVDPAFRPAEFLDKAKKAFGMILAAFSGGNRMTLGTLLAPSLLADFNALIDAREAARETYVTQLHTITRAVIADAMLDGTMARVTVDFTAEQGITQKDFDGRIISNNNGHRRNTKDRWVFVRDLKDPSPSWLLAEIVSHED